MVREQRERSPVSPGKVLKRLYMEPYRLSARRVGELIGVPGNRISRIVNGSQAITIDTAHRLAKLFGTTPDLWMNLQHKYEREMAEWGLARGDGIYRELGRAIEQIETLDPELAV